MPWKVAKLQAFVKPQSGAYFWTAKSDYVINRVDPKDHKEKDYKAEIHVTVAPKEIDTKLGTFKQFHVKFDVKSSPDLMVYFNFTESGGNASLNGETGDGNAAKLGIAKGEYADMKGEAIGFAKK